MADNKEAINKMLLKKEIWDIVSYVWNIFKMAIDKWASDYIFAVVTIPTFKSYQLAWQIVENDVKKARINGTYYRDPAGSDVVWLISPATASGALIDGGEIGIGNTNDLYNPAP